MVENPGTQGTSINYSRRNRRGAIIPSTCSRPRASPCFPRLWLYLPFLVYDALWLVLQSGQPTLAYRASLGLVTAVQHFSGRDGSDLRRAVITSRTPSRPKISSVVLSSREAQQVAENHIRMDSRAEDGYRADMPAWSQPLVPGMSMTGTTPGTVGILEHDDV